MITELIELGGKGAQTLWGLFGGEEPYDQFNREIAPVLLKEAQLQGCPAFCYWYGEVVGVDRSGQLVSLGSAPSNTAWDDIVQQYANVAGKALQYKGNGEPQFYVYRGTGSGGTGAFPATYIGSGFSSSEPVLASIIPSDMGSMVPWLVMGGVAAIFLFGRKAKARA